MIEAGVEVEATAAPRSLPAAAAAAAAVSEATKIRRDWAVFNSGVFSWNRAPGGEGKWEKASRHPDSFACSSFAYRCSGGKMC